MEVPDETREEAEAILRRFTRTGLQHPTYRAFLELGKAVKTIFLCRYLSSEALRREFQEGLNVIENWNGQQRSFSMDTKEISRRTGSMSKS